MSNPKGSLTKRVEKLEEMVEQVKNGAASALGLNVVIEMLGREKFNEALVAYNKKRQEEAEATMAKQVQAALDAKAIQPATEVGDRTIFVVGRGKEGLADYRVHITLPPGDHANRKRWLGKKAGDVVSEPDGTQVTATELYDVAAPQPAKEG